jgi:hypothetical protein
MTLRLKPLLVALVACALLTGIAPAAHAAKGMEMALQDDGVFVSQAYYNRDRALTRARQLHVTRLRVNLNWNVVLGRASRSRTAPRRIAYNWAIYDGVVTAAARRGLAVQFSLTGPAPAFATSDHRVGPTAPNAHFYGQFVRAAAQHFAGRVDRYSIWNEPNYRGWISPMNRAPRIYRALYVAGYSAIKSADPTAQVLFGETSPYAIPGRATAPLQFLRGVVCADSSWHAHCGGLKTDGYAHHPYDFKHKPTYEYPGKDNVTVSTLGRLTSALSKLRRARLLSTPSGGVPYLYLTEYGYFSSGKYKLSSSKQGKYLVQGFTIAQRNERVKQMLQYLLIKPGGHFRNFDTSIVSRSGKPSRAFNMLASWASKAAKAGQIAATPKP